MTLFEGHEQQVKTMLEAASSGRLHHGWILAGPQGIGKGAFARAMALRLLADAAGPPITTNGVDVPPDHPVARIMAAGSHPDYAELECLEREKEGTRARNISVDQIRGLSRLIHSVPSLSHRRVVVIDSADDLERGAANALLKSLEEPPADMLFLLVAHAPARLLPTIRSRCHVLRFDPLNDDAMRRILRVHQGDDMGDAELDVLLRAGEGSPGKALRYAGLHLAEMEQALTAISTHGDLDNRERLALVKMLSGKAAKPRFEAFLERAPAFIAQAARTLQGDALGNALSHWDEARQLASGAVILSLEPQSVVFELASHVAALAPSHLTT